MVPRPGADKSASVRLIETTPTARGSILLGTWRAHFDHVAPSVIENGPVVASSFAGDGGQFLDRSRARRLRTTDVQRPTKPNGHSLAVILQDERLLLAPLFVLLKVVVAKEMSCANAISLDPIQAHRTVASTLVGLQCSDHEPVGRMAA